jgi:protein-arginine kinase activator protein McsA
VAITSKEIQTMTTNNTRKCSNCPREADVAKMLQVSSHGRVVAHICDTCQQAKKISVTLVKEAGQWKYYQFFPVEA